MSKSEIDSRPLAEQEPMDGSAAESWREWAGRLKKRPRQHSSQDISLRKKINILRKQLKENQTGFLKKKAEIAELEAELKEHHEAGLFKTIGWWFRRNFGSDA